MTYRLYKPGNKHDKFSGGFHSPLKQKVGAFSFPPLDVSVLYKK